jgi:hypothetical protein
MPNNTSPHFIIDKNGRATTVHKRVGAVAPRRAIPVLGANRSDATRDAVQSTSVANEALQKAQAAVYAENAKALILSVNDDYPAATTILLAPYEGRSDGELSVVALYDASGDELEYEFGSMPEYDIFASQISPNADFLVENGPYKVIDVGREDRRVSRNDVYGGSIPANQGKRFDWERETKELRELSELVNTNTFPQVVKHLVNNYGLSTNKAERVFNGVEKALLNNSLEFEKNNSADYSDDPPHYRLYLSNEGEPVYINVQSFDYYDYDSERLIGERYFDSKEEATAAFHFLVEELVAPANE